jgi:nucleotide-binding universal stress UspA family protein
LNIKEIIMKKMLIAVDDSKCAMKGVEYAGEQFGGMNDLQITLVHVLPNLPAIFWDEGHILSEAEKAERKKVVDRWMDGEKKKIGPLFARAVDVLTRKGIKKEQVTTKFISDSTDVAQSLIEEAKDGGYQTLVMGRCGVSQGKSALAGSVTSKIIHLAAGVAVTVVE